MRKKVIITLIAILVILSIVIIFIIQIDKSKINVLRDKSLSVKNDLDIPNLIPFQKNNKWGFYNRSKTIVVEPKYEWVKFPHWSDYSDKYLVVKHNGLWGVINKSGEKIVPFIYDELEFVENVTGQFIAQKGDYFGVIDSLNDILFPFKFNKIEGVGKNFIVGEKTLNGTLYSLLDSDGRKILTDFYDFDGFNNRNKDDLFIVSKIVKADKNYIPWNETRRVLGCVDIKGNVIVPLKYEKIEISGRYFIVSDYDKQKRGSVFNNSYGVCDNRGKVLIPLIYDRIEHFIKVGKGVFVCYKNPKVKIVDSLNQTIIPYRYNYIYNINHKNNDIYIFAMEGYLNGLLNLNGEVTVPFDYTSLLDPYNIGLIAAKKSMKAGFIDYNNNIVIPFEYEDVNPFSEGLALVKKISADYIKGNLRIEGKVNYDVNWFSDYVGQGKLYTSNEFEKEMKNPINREEFYERIKKYDKRFGSLEEFELYMTLGDWRKKIPGKYGFIDTKNKVRINLIYDEAKDFKNGYAEVRINKNWGVINIDGKIVIPIKYEEINRSRFDRFKDLFGIYKNGEFIGYVDVNGAEYFN